MAEKQEPKEVKTKAQRALDAKHRYEQLIVEAETEALDGIKLHLDTLIELGKPHVVITQAEYDGLKAPVAQYAAPRATKQAGTAKSPAPSAKGYDASKICPVCKTTGHDGRAHRSQGANKVAFTPIELDKMGLTPPAGTPVQASL